MRNRLHLPETMASDLTENVDPNVTNKPFSTNGVSANKRVVRSPQKPTILSPHRRRSSSHFVRVGIEEDSSEDESQMPVNNCREILTIDYKSPKKNGKTRRRRRSSARFLSLADRIDSEYSNNENDTDVDGGGGNRGSPTEGEFASVEHLGEIYRQAIRMNAENKINAGNSWGLKLIENMDKFIEEDGTDLAITPRDGINQDITDVRKVTSKDEKGRINFAKASCTLDASVKIYSYRVDDVHLSSYRVLANLNRTDNKKDNALEHGDQERMESSVEGDERKEKIVSRRRNLDKKGNIETIETNMANINMSKLDSAYDIDPLFHKMSKAFDEGGAKGLLLGNLGVSSNGCHIVFDSKEEFDTKLKASTENVSETKEDMNSHGEEKNDANTKDDNSWKESMIDITSLAAKLERMLVSYGVKSSNDVPFVPQLESLRNDYAKLEAEGFGINEKEVVFKGRRRLTLYDTPEDEEKEAEKSIHYIALEKSRASGVGASFDANLGLSLDSEDGCQDGFFPVGEAEGDLLGGEGEFAPVDYDARDRSDLEKSTIIMDTRKSPTDMHSCHNAKILLDALCDGDAFSEDIGGSNDYAYFDLKKFEKVTDGNLWVGPLNWKRLPTNSKQNCKNRSDKKVTFDAENEKKEKKKLCPKKDLLFVNFSEVPNVDSIFFKKKDKSKKSKKKSDDPYQMSKTEKDFLLPQDAEVNISQLFRLFSRPNAVVRRVDPTSRKSGGKNVGFYDVEETSYGFNENNAFGGDNNTSGLSLLNTADAFHPHDDADYHVEGFDDVRKVKKIDVGYATVAKKVDVRRLKKDLWDEVKDRIAIQPLCLDPETNSIPPKADEIEQVKSVSFKETVEKMDGAQNQHDVTVSFYFICCLHLANENVLKLDSAGLDDFMISFDDGKATMSEKQVSDEMLNMCSLASSRSKRERNIPANYIEQNESDEDNSIMDSEN